MLEFIKPITQCIDPAFNLEATSIYRLSIKISFDGFSFCVLDPATKTYLLLEDYRFYKDHQVENVNLLSKAISELVKNNAYLSKSFEAVHVIYDDKRNTLIPSVLFDKKEAQALLDMNHQLTEDDLVLYDYLTKTDSYNIFAVPSVLVQTLKETFTNCRIFHVSSILIEQLLAEETNLNQYMLSVNCCEQHFHLTIIKENQLLLYNVFPYANADDVFYYLLLVIKELNIKIENVRFMFEGTISDKSELFEELKNNISGFQLRKRNKIFNYGQGFDLIDQHAYHDLLNTCLCGL